jgi:hypothetical protein
MVAMGFSIGRAASRVIVAVALAATCLLAVAACGGSPHHINRDPGLVVAELPIPLSSPPTPVVQVAVTVGERFSVEVDTSDGPLEWSEIGPKPNPRIVKVAGDFNDGNCKPRLVGCRVPYFHTLQAKAPGTTTMTWHFVDFDCQNSQDSSNSDCTHNTVKFEIKVS